MKQIKFSKCPVEPHKGQSWDKLVLPTVGDTFTTFRGYEVRKHAYYGRCAKDKEVFEVVEEGKKLGIAELMDVEGMLSNMITDEEIRDDTFQTADTAFFNRLISFFYKLDESIAVLKLTLKWVGVE